MSRKKTVKIPKRVKLTCPACRSPFSLSLNGVDSLYSYECKNKECKSVITTPVTKCCLICAFTNKQCPSSLKMEAKVKGLEIR